MEVRKRGGKYKRKVVKLILSDWQCLLTGQFQSPGLPARVADPDPMDGSGCNGRIRILWTDPGVTVGSGSYGRIRMLR